MPNSIRTPRAGKSEYSRRVAQAVDDEAWQRFRVSLKGLNTSAKLAALGDYFAAGEGAGGDTEDVFIRVDNYLKALARGGLITLSGPFEKDFSHVHIVRE